MRASWLVLLGVCKSLRRTGLQVLCVTFGQDPGYLGPCSETTNEAEHEGNGSITVMGEASRQRNISAEAK